MNQCKALQGQCCTGFEAQHPGARRWALSAQFFRSGYARFAIEATKASTGRDRRPEGTKRKNANVRTRASRTFSKRRHSAVP